MPDRVARAWCLSNWPVGMPTRDCFELTTVPLPEVGEGDIAVENLWLSIEPSIRLRIGPPVEGVSGFALGEPISGQAIGRVVESRFPGLAPGDLVTHGLGWRDRAVLPGEAAFRLPTTSVPLETFLGVLGYSGLTAYVGMVQVAKVQPGDVVFVSGAAGAVGSMAVQLARLKGAARVIGSAGGAAKVAFLRTIGCDEAIDYRAEPDLGAALARAAPDGVDVYFDNVGGAHLAAALDNARVHARFAECGMIASYNSGDSSAPAQLFQVIVKRIRMEGFGGPDILDQIEPFRRDMIPLVEAGAIQAHSTVHVGLEAVPEAFIGLLSGKNRGKMLVKLEN